MMRTFCFAWIFVCGCLGYANAQNQPVRQRRQLQQQVIERLMQNGRVQAGLSDDQFGRYREIAARVMSDRNDIHRRVQGLWRALEGQMRPGVAADEDSVTALIDSLIVVPEQLVEIARIEQEEYAEFLSPVQRAQLMLTHRRFDENVRQIMQRRVPNRPGLGGSQP